MLDFNGKGLGKLEGILAQLLVVLEQREEPALCTM